MKFTKILSATIALATLNTHAGNEIGNGGIGVVLNGSSYVWLLDFAENGIDFANYGDVELDPNILSRVNSHLKGELCHSLKVGWRADDICVKVAQKFSELQAADPIMFNYLFYAFEKLDFKAVDADLVPIDDIGVSPIEYERSQLRQLATRAGTTVRFDRRLVHKTSLYNEDHLVGLVFHEVMYSTAGDKAPIARQIRESIGYLFGNAAMRGFPDLAARMPAHFPAVSRMAGQHIGKWRIDEEMDLLKLRFYREELGIEVHLRPWGNNPPTFVIASINDIGSPSHAKEIERSCSESTNYGLQKVHLGIQGSFASVWPVGSVAPSGDIRDRTSSFISNWRNNDFESYIRYDEDADCVRRVTALIETQVRKIFESYRPLEEIGLYPRGL